MCPSLVSACTQILHMSRKRTKGDITMNKYLTLTLAALAVSQVAAAEVDLGASMTVSGQDQDPALLGLTLSAEHYSKVAERSSLYVGSSFYIPGKAVVEGGPVLGNIVVGGSFLSADFPASVQIGLAAVAQSPASSEQSIVFAPAVVTGSKFSINDAWHIKSNAMVTLPVSASGEISRSDAVLSSSIGVVHSVAIAV